MTAASHERTLQQLHQHRSIFSLFTGSHFSRNRLQISSPFTGLRSLVIIWIARFFACIINITKAASLVSFEYRSFQARTILPTDSLPHLRVPLEAFHQPQASLVRVQYLEVNWFSCFFLGILENWSSCRSCFIDYHLLTDQVILLMIKALNKFFHPITVTLLLQSTKKLFGP